MNSSCTNLHLNLKKTFFSGGNPLACRGIKFCRVLQRPLPQKNIENNRDSVHVYISNQHNEIQNPVIKRTSTVPGAIREMVAIVSSVAYSNSRENPSICRLNITNVTVTLYVHFFANIDNNNNSS